MDSKEIIIKENKLIQMHQKSKSIDRKTGVAAYG